MASNLTTFVPVPDGTRATPDVINSRFSQLQLNIVSTDSLAHDIQSGAVSLGTGVVGAIQLADRAVTGVKLATSAVTTRALDNASVTSLKITTGGVASENIAAAAVIGSKISVNDSRFTVSRLYVRTQTGGIVGDPTGGGGARFTSEGIYWSLHSLIGFGSIDSVGVALADVITGPTGAYRVSMTGLPEIGIVSGGTTYLMAHNAGLIISNSSTPLGTGTGVVGDFRWGSDNTGAYVYVCISANSWSRATLHMFG